MWRELRAGVILAFIILCFGTTGCTRPEIVKDRMVRVNVPVAQACAGERPTPVVPLKVRVPDDEWAALDAKQKAALVGRQALDRLTYGERLAAATGACR